MFGPAVENADEVLMASVLALLGGKGRVSAGAVGAA